MNDLLSVSVAATQSYKRALTAVQTNISNLNTEGYSRQKISITAPGESTSVLSRSHDAFAENGLRSANASLAFEQPGINYAGRVLNLVGSESSSLTTAFDQFFSSSKQLAADPSSDASRQTFLSNSGFLASRVNAVASELQDLAAENNAEVEHRINQLNGLSSQLAVINEELAAFSGNNQPPSLLDQRDLVLMKMSGLAKINVSFNDSGLASVNLAIPNEGVALVDNIQVKNLSVEPVSGSKNMQRVMYDVSGANSEITSVTGGSIGGLLSAKSSVIDPLVTSLNGLAYTFATRVNEQHGQGLTPQGTMGGDLFSLGADANYAENLSLALTSSDQIAAAGRLKISAAASNSSGVQASLSFGEDATWNGSLESAFTISFSSATEYSITQGGITTNHSGFDLDSGIVVGDVKVSFDRAPAALDSFSISANTDGIGDNTNALGLAAISNEAIFSGKTLRNFYISEVGKVSTFNDLSKMSSEAKQAVYDNAMSAKDKISGVNLDEEAAELIRLQQAYLATAKAMQTANDVFEQLLRLGV